MTRHEFLRALHDLLKPEYYLEIGVQHGWSLQLSKAEVSIGVDPQPMHDGWKLHGNGHHIYQMTSDTYFKTVGAQDQRFIDLAFIDGMHLFEYAMRDFLNVEKKIDRSSVVVFDDVMPRNHTEASRKIPAVGDWTGDVWRVYGHLRRIRPEADLILVDTEPTGVLVVTNLTPPHDDRLETEDVSDGWLFLDSLPVPSYILSREHAWPADLVLERLRRRRQ